jgi:hypothetical protein
VTVQELIELLEAQDPDSPVFFLTDEGARWGEPYDITMDLGGVVNVWARQGPPTRWVHCSPELLASGVDCDATPRRACRCAHGGSHDHLVPEDGAV